MKNKKPDNFNSLPFRLLGGGYLLYLAWDLRTMVHQGPAVLIAVLVFAVAGAVVVGHSMYAMGWFARKTPPEQEEKTESEVCSDG